jgi:hypothetical protein
VDQSKGGWRSDIVVCFGVLVFLMALFFVLMYVGELKSL